MKLNIKTQYTCFPLWDRESMDIELETYREIVENSADAIMILVDLNIVFANKTALEIYGADKPEDLIGKNALSIGLLTPAEHGQSQEIEMKRISGDLSHGIFEFPATMKDGRKAIFEVGISNIQFSDKVGALCIIRDVTQRKDSENRLESLHDSTALLGQATTREQAVDIVLDTIQSIFGKHYAAIAFVEENKLVFRKGLGKNIYDELALDGPGISVRAVRTGMTQVVNDVSNDPDYVDGRVSDVKSLSELDVPILVNDVPVALITIEEDKTDSFNVEEVQLVEILANHFASALERIRHHSELMKMREDHIMELVGGMDKICMRVQEDLKGPLGTIRNSSFIIRHNPELTAEVVDNIDNSIELMTNTLEEMKEITSPTEPEKAITDIFSVLQGALHISYIPRKIKLVNDSETGFLAISVDKEKIQRVFFNIITNALEAMPNGGTLHISHEIQDKYVEFSFKDTGPGIPPEVMDRIYDPFYSTKPKSLGLGLSFCKLAVESTGGKISIDSVVGEGTTVSIRLPK
ncbi:MAG: ATP-binding protein [Candidatus Bathyarchaeota archaeon]|nr:ATP-binding protein [Candidatus Bathyarchaeota archaeon]